MKKISRILMCASLLLGFAACSDSDSGDDGDNNGTQLAANQADQKNSNGEHYSSKKLAPGRI